MSMKLWLFFLESQKGSEPKAILHIDCSPGKAESADTCLDQDFPLTAEG